MCALLVADEVGKQGDECKCYFKQRWRQAVVQSIWIYNNLQLFVATTAPEQEIVCARELYFLVKSMHIKATLHRTCAQHPHDPSLQWALYFVLTQFHTRLSCYKCDVMESVLPYVTVFHPINPLRIHREMFRIQTGTSPNLSFTLHSVSEKFTSSQ